MAWQPFSWRCLSVVTLDALTPASVHSLWSSPKCLNQLYLTVFSSLQSSLLLVHIFLPNFFFPVNLAFNMLWYSTRRRATPFSNDPLSFTLFVRVSLIVFWTIAKSAVFPIIVVSKNEVPRIYTVWMVIYWNSNVNIIIFWDTDFRLSLALIIKIKTKQLLMCFTLHVMNLKYMNVSLFEISYKISFSPYF